LQSTKQLKGASRKPGIIRPLDPDDPRSLDHPSHKEQWLELARTLGRLGAREEYERLHGDTERQSNVRKAKTRDRA
jgi:hypothetical protein